MAASASAQGTEPQEAVAPVTQPERVAPSVIELPDIVLPDGAPAVESVAATIVVSVEGVATLEESDAPPEIAAAIVDALSRARFSPAKVNGEPVVARVRIVLRVAPPVVAPPVSTPDAVPTPITPQIEDTLPPNPFDETEPAAYRATGRTKPVPPAARRMQLEEMRDVPGTFGDPFRILDTLPGVLPIFSGLPYVYVRGAPPASTSYVYDDISIPLLFHFGIAAAVIHPAMLGDLLFYSSVAPARYGRKTGGVFGAEGPELRDKLHGEVELRLIDVSAMLNVPVANGGSITAAARYGYPGLALSLVAENATLAYWDYQLRVDVPVGAHDRFQLTWFGSYDKAGEVGDELTITFHRIETRLLHEIDTVQLGAALQLGFDQTGVTDGFQIESARFGPRMWLTWKPSYAVSLRVGADMLATAGEIYDEGNSSGVDGPAPDPGGGPRPDPGGPRPDPGGGDGGGDDDPLSGADPVSQRVKGRNMIGAYGDLRLRPSVVWELALGVRADVWMTGTAEQAAAEPRASVTYHPTRDSDVFAAAGLGYQPAVFPIPIPGLADIVLDRGLQRAIQTEVGYRRDLGDELRLETSLFFSHYSGMLFFETAFDCSQDDPDDDTDPDSSCENGRFPRATSDAYGWEVFLKRPGHHRVSGWISYTLGRATAESAAGRAIIPQTDVRHFGSAVLQVQLGRNWTLGSRAFFRTGRVPFEKDIYRPNHRLPGFYRLDLTLANRWKTSWGHMRLSLEWFNVTLSREAVSYQCTLQSDMTQPNFGQLDCETEYAPALFFPNLGLRGEF